jgi:cyclopropane-fatty-acyl-phospholipid synthase
MAGDFDSDELGAFLTVLCCSLTDLVPQWMQRLRALYVARHPRDEANTVRQARGNIARHYDLSNEMFATFLDESMTYSSALFADLDRPEPLRDAQRRKIDRLLDVAGVGEGTLMLEIGTGWGELALRAAARGARVHSVTLSQEQLELARRRVEAAGLADRVRIELCDYRDVAVPPEGGYDAVVSVEMIEAVGYEFWPTYFAAIDALLAPGGKVALQAITMPHDRMLATRNTWTWINKYIFPGGLLPSTEAIAGVTREHTSLEIQQRLSMGAHYARTLREWDARFTAARDEVRALGFDDVFERMWHFYLCYSEAGFASGYLDVQQIQLAKGAR